MGDLPPSLPAKRSNPLSRRAPRSLDCFVASLLAMTVQVARKPRRLMAAAEAAKMGVAEAASIFEAIAEHPVHPDVGDPDEAERSGDRRAECEGREGERQRQSVGVDEIVGERARSRPDA